MKCYSCPETENIRPLNKNGNGYGTFICRPCNNKRSKKYYDNYKKLVFDHYGRACACCGETIYQFLTIDHINNDGSSDLNGKGNKVTGIHLYNKIVREGFKNTYQVLCMNCNFGKRMNSGICPHFDIA